MNKRLILLLFALLVFFTGRTQNKEPKMTIQFLANDQIADVNLEQEKFIQSVKQITDYLKSSFSTISEKQKIGILMTVHKQGKPSYALYANPEMDKKEKEKILNGLTEIAVDNTLLVDFPLFFALNTEGEDVYLNFEDFENPVKKVFTSYEKADFQTKYQLIREYAANEALPVLTAYLTKVDDKFEGVKGFGKQLEAANLTASQSMEQLTSTNKNYWRATMEMSPGNQLIPVTKIFLLAAQGELDYAQKYLEIVRLFSDPKTASSRYLEQLNYRLTKFNQELQAKIEAGIAQHDKKNYKEAIRIYDDILLTYPNSAWTLYEKYYTENALASDQSDNDRARWDKAKAGIYKHNPLYNMDVRASNGKEAYLLFRRQEIAGLFKKKENKLSDLSKYAEIALDLGVTDFAAQLFWLSATFDKQNSEKSIHYYLYCLEKMGEHELKSNFKGDFEKIFREIDTERENTMKSSIFYKSMKN